MNKNAKKIITKEALMLTGFLAAAFLAGILFPDRGTFNFLGIDLPCKVYGLTSKSITILCVYPVYLLIRFVVWAIRR